ncbi:MAG: hypothetical protein WC291_00195 [Thermodesulfovibrionales bacterium]
MVKLADQGRDLISGRLLVKVDSKVLDKLQYGLTVQGNFTVAVITEKEDTTKIYVGVAKKSSMDEYSLVTGARIAMSRAFKIYMKALHRMEAASLSSNSGDPLAKAKNRKGGMVESKAR